MKTRKRLGLAVTPFTILYELTHGRMNKRVSFHLTCLSYLSTVELHVFGVYNVSILITESVQVRIFKIPLLYSFISILSVLLWHSLMHQKDNLERLKYFLKSNQLKLKTGAIANRNRFSSILLAIFLITPLILSILHVYTTHENHNSDYFLYGYSRMEDKLHFFFCCAGAYTYYSIFMKYPVIMALSMCVLIHRYGLLLHKCNADFKDVSACINSSKCNAILNNYFEILHMIRFLKQTLSIPLCFAMLIGFFCIYSAIEYGFNNNGEELYVFYVELLSNVLTGTLLLCSIAMPSARIPEYLRDMKTTAEFLLDKHPLNNIQKTKSLVLLKRIERKQTIYLSACGFVHIQKGFLLSAFGSFITYGILISSLH
ncbi:uncharacterized protein CDAR_595041 [Caerostris darwini]|uniref:Gustatory receptor n=1 Tax=Caerostris darwini TaxID=1538125 RepID=A0AAV4P9U7_9ARAC|nr:uncharacterized protein CDAR_595041 [Caerostris darwini]